MRPPVDDARRLEKGGEADASRPVGPPTGAIPDDWTRHPALARAETEPVKAGDLEIVSLIHEHRVEARRGGKVAWSVTADGRVSHAPLVLGDLVLFGSHDGWVYSVRLADGAPVWRHLVAPYSRKMVAYGQLESSWPVYGLAIHEGLVVASAGTHPELAGGVHVAALDPRTGVAAWRKILRKPPAAIRTANGKSTGTIVPQCFLNEAPLSEEGRIRIGGFSFDPKESDVEIEKRLSTPPPKKKK